MRDARQQTRPTGRRVDPRGDGSTHEETSTTHAETVRLMRRRRGDPPGDGDPRAPRENDGGDTGVTHGATHGATSGAVRGATQGAAPVTVPSRLIVSPRAGSGRLHPGASMARLYGSALAAAYRDPREVTGAPPGLSTAAGEPGRLFSQCAESLL